MQQSRRWHSPKASSIDANRLACVSDFGLSRSQSLRWPIAMQANEHQGGHTAQVESSQGQVPDQVKDNQKTQVVRLGSRTEGSEVMHSAGRGSYRWSECFYTLSEDHNSTSGHLGSRGISLAIIRWRIQQVNHFISLGNAWFWRKQGVWAFYQVPPFEAHGNLHGALHLPRDI